MNDWPELDALYEELRQANEEHWKRTQELREQLSSLQPHLEVIASQFQELQVDEHLRAINDRLLGGLGSVEIVHGGVGIEYAAALVWPGHVHPQAEGQQTAPEDIYRIDVWLGPGMEDGRARIRIHGAKRLEAVLPTSGERFRSALLTVFRNPQRVPRPSSEERETNTPAPQEDGTETQESLEQGQTNPAPNDKDDNLKTNERPLPDA
jgi:hypothetical protein